MWNGQCGVILSKNTDITDAHGWVFSRIIYSCSAAYCLGFDAPPAQRIATDFSHAENLSMRARFSGHALPRIFRMRRTFL